MRHTALIAVAMLSGCATPYWAPDPAWSDFHPQNIVTRYTDDINAMCGYPANTMIDGCAVRLRQASLCIAYISSRLPDWRKAEVDDHERRHCLGEQHPGQLTPPIAPTEQELHATRMQRLRGW